LWYELGESLHTREATIIDGEGQGTTNATKGRKASPFLGEEDVIKAKDKLSLEN